ncbi:MAG: phosphoglucosamine mutase [Candidatus Margulisbacteria bacterium]|nr:phosphoglucosamine mutase [Candidatus Margulisiibacteriota bacterium]
MSHTSLKITVAGIRGKIGESLVPAVALDFAEIFGTLNNGGKIILGTDTRLSTTLIKSAVISGLVATGCEIIDIGVVSTPTTQLMVRHLKAAGGIMITASHNPIMWNGLKFISGKGIFWDENEMHRLFDFYHKWQNVKKKAETVEDLVRNVHIKYKDIQNLGKVETFPEAVNLHIDEVLKQVDVKLIKKAKLKVVADCCNGAGAVMNPYLFKKLGVEASYIFDTPDGRFEREPEPLPENLTALRKAVIKNKADIGFAQDADADRLAIVNEDGNPIGEDYTLVLVLKYLLSRHPNPKGKVVATNLSTTRAFDDVANEYKAKIIHTKIGEVNVSKALMDNDSILGGEGNGGVIIPSIGYGRDSFAGMAFVLEYMAKRNLKISELVKEIPVYKFVKKKKEVSSAQDIAKILTKTRQLYRNEIIDDTDGIKVILKDSWLHVRGSNTEPIVRYFAEAKTLAKAKELIDNVF